MNLVIYIHWGQFNFKYADFDIILWSVFLCLGVGEHLPKIS